MTENNMPFLPSPPDAILEHEEATADLIEARDSFMKARDELDHYESQIRSELLAEGGDWANAKNETMRNALFEQRAYSNPGSEYYNLKEDLREAQLGFKAAEDWHAHMNMKLTFIITITEKMPVAVPFGPDEQESPPSKTSVLPFRQKDE